MRVEYTGRHMEVPAEVRRLGDRKLQKLAKVLPGITDVHVILTADKHRQIAEVKVHSPHLDLAATEESGDVALSLSTVVEKLTRQAQRHTGKLRERKRRAPARATALWEGVLRGAPGAPREQGVPRVIRSQRFVVKPMTVEEAALEVGASPEGVLVFRDASTERVNVLYRRKDGNLGLIEPEA
jgi:putative sigma-54 modulation protein